MTPRESLLELIRSQAVLRGDFVLTSGSRSDYYIDARKVTLSARGSKLVGRVIWDFIRSDKPDAIAGPTLGADPIVTAVAMTSEGSPKPVDALIVRKATKEHGTGNRIEGPLREGMSVVFVEDTTTTGGSAVEAIDGLLEAGVGIQRFITLIDREGGARSLIENKGLRFDAVFTVTEILGLGEGLPLDSPTRRDSRSLVLHADGSSVGNPGRAGAGFVLYDSNMNEVRRGSDRLGIATNNVAEYEALIRGMEAAIAESANELTVRMDSELIIKQMKGEYRVKHPSLQSLYAQAQAIAARFRSISFEHIRREGNRLADSLATSASAR